MCFYVFIYKSKIYTYKIFLQKELILVNVSCASGKNMSATSNVLSIMISPGFFGSMVITDFVLAMAIVCFLKLVIVPVAQLHLQAKHLDELIGSVKRHWLLGHRKEVRSFMEACSFVVSFVCRAMSGHFCMHAWYGFKPEWIPWFLK